jgi:hypothetical protein
MDCGDAGHILVSKRVAEDLQQNGRWRPHLHDLGQVSFASRGFTILLFATLTQAWSITQLSGLIFDGSLTPCK